MSDNNTKNEPVIENTETSESQISETQEQLLDSTLVDAADSYETIKAQHEAGEISDEDLLFALSEGNMTEEQFVEIRGLPSAEVQTLINAEPAKVEPLLSLEAANEKIFEIIKNSDGNTKAAGGLAIVNAWAMRNEISKETHEALVASLTEMGKEDGSISDGSNRPPNPMDEALADMLSTYKPQHQNIDEANKTAANVVGIIIRQRIQEEGTQVSRLIVAFSDLAYFFAQNKELAIVRRGDKPEDIAKSIPWSGTTHNVLWNLIKKHNSLGEVKTAIGEKVGTRVKTLGDTYNPYTDPAITNLKDAVLKRAVIHAFGHLTGARFGYMAKKSLNARPSKTMVFESEVADEKDYFKVQCIPQNVIFPLKDQHLVPDRVGTETVGWHLEGGTVNDNEALVWLSNKDYEAVYQHLHGQEYDYYLKSSGTDDLPDGSILGCHDPRYESNRSRESSTQELAKLKVEFEKTKAALEGAQKGISKENRVGTLQALESYVGNKNMPIDEKEPYHAFNLALVMVKRITSNGKDPSEADLKVMLELMRAIGTIIVDEPGSEPVYKSPIGGRQHQIAA